MAVNAFASPSGKWLSEPGIKPGFFMQKKSGPEVRKRSRWL
jgi:hypothetical protein